VIIDTTAVMIMTERLASITSRSSFCSMFLSSSAIVLHFDPYLFNNNNVLSSFLLLSLELVCVFHCWLMLKVIYLSFKEVTSKK
jgi:hypothetical protein